MKRIHKSVRIIMGAVVILSIVSMWMRTGRLRAQSAAPPAAGQQMTGIPGSPTATTTIGGEQLPPRTQQFGGKIERNAANSTPYWPMRVVPPKGAPNVLLIMTDDTGFGYSC